MNDNFQAGGLALLKELQKKAPKGKWDNEQAVEAINEIRVFLRDYLELETAEELFVTSPRSPEELTPAEAIEEAKSLIARMAEVMQSMAMAEDVLLATETGASTANFPEELGNIDFSKLIGGPLQAAVQAQVASSVAGANFIREVGFEKKDDGSPGKVINVEFIYEKVSGNNKDGQPITELRKVTVPLLSMLVIPSLRIEEVNIDFNVKLNSAATSNVSSTLKVDAEVGAKFGPVNFKVTAGYQRTASSGIEIKKEYTMNVKVKATQDSIPAGLDRIFNMLAESIKDEAHPPK